MDISRIILPNKQAPWRTHRQKIAWFLGALIAITMVAAIYLSVTANAAITGREIQNLQAAISSNQLINADLEASIASLLSTREMESRAEVIGFQPIKPDEVEYIVVPGYVPPEPVIPFNGFYFETRSPVTPPEYTQSLLDWFNELIRSPETINIGIQQ
ncbi:MAG: hypothetical protein MUP03_06435 [Anaerolineales bacterium]|nr:hypothetical protein [Anaerolineales bacterium]